MIFIDYHSRMPIYEQIKEQIMMLVTTGVYQPDEQLPSIRALSGELNINVNTIKRAFSELEREGITYSVPGKGVFISPNALGNTALTEAALENIAAAVRSGRAKGVGKERLLQLIDAIYEEGPNDD